MIKAVTEAVRKEQICTKQVYIGKLRLFFIYLFIAMLYLLWQKLERLSRYKITRDR